MEIAGTAVVRDRKAPLASCEARARRAFERGQISLEAYRRLIDIAAEAGGEGGTSVTSGGDSARWDAGGSGRLKRMHERGFGLSARARRFRSEEEADGDEGEEGAAAKEESDERLLQFADICLKTYPPYNSYQSDLKIPREVAPPVPRDKFLAGDESTSPNSPTQLQPQTMNVWFRPHGLAAYSSSMSLSSEESEAENGSLGINSDIKSIVDTPPPPNSPPLMAAVHRPSNSFTRLHPHRHAMNRSCVTFLSKESEVKNIAHATSSEIKPAVENRPDEVAKLDPSLSLIRSEADIEAPARSAARIHEETLESLEERNAGANGSWTEDEHARFLSAFLRHGRDWIAVAACVGTRTNLQCSAHAPKCAKSIVDERGHEGAARDPIASHPIASHQENEAQADVEAPAILPMSINEAPPISKTPTDKGEVMRVLLNDPGYGNVEGTGRWTRQEHDSFLSAIVRHGKNWGAITACVGTRTLEQIRSHAQKYVERRRKNEIQADVEAPAVSPMPIGEATANSKTPTDEEVMRVLVDQSSAGNVEGAGRWTREEHERFLSATVRHGRNWGAVAASVGTRTRAQVRWHAEQYAERTKDDDGPRGRPPGGRPEIPRRKNARTGRWTKEEHRLFADAYRRHGRDWKKVTADVKTRTKLQVRTHAQKYLSRLKKDAEMNGNDN